MQGCFKILKHKTRRLSLVMGGFLCLWVLSACSADEILKASSISSAQPDYKISGLSEHEGTRDYLKKILENRMDNNVTAKDEVERLRQQRYQRRMMKRDLIKALKSQGFYDAKIAFDRDDGRDDKLSGTYEVNEGPRYSIRDITINPPEFQEHLELLQVDIGDALVTKRVLAGQARLYNAIQKDKCYFQLDVTHKAVLDTEEKTAVIAFVVEAGEEAVFDAVTFTGQESVKESYLQKLIPFRQGHCYRREKIDSLQQKLLATGLFSRSNVVLPEAPIEEGAVPLNVELKERAARTIRLGGSYYTDEGPGLVAAWEHRNFFGAAEKFQAALQISQFQQRLEADLAKPYFIRDDQSLLLTASFNHKESEAFDETSINAGGSIKRDFSQKFSGQIGVELTISEIKDKSNDDTEAYGLLSFPTQGTFDTRDNILSPTEGQYVQLSGAPFVDVLGNSNPFFKTRLSARTYFGFERDIVLALRASIGSIQGAEIDNIPAPERFYAGGGGSVRGFGYQEVGPSLGGDPSGGASVVEGAVELRFKINDTIGAAAFVDAGNVDQSATPNLDELSIGAGVGLRYYTAFGPLRFDVATPLTKKEDTSQNYQIYISIGQAF